MNQVVTLNGVEEKKCGENQYGPWALRVFTAAGGTKYQTFDVDLGDQLIGHLNLPLEITYEIEDRQYKDNDGNTRTAQNNVIKGWKPSENGSAATVSASEPVQPTSPSTASTGSQDEFRRSKEEMRYTEAVKAAAVVLASDQDFSVEQLKQMADAIAELIAEPR